MTEAVRGISVVRGTESREAGNSSGFESTDRDHSLSVSTVAKYRPLPVDPLVTFLAEATRFLIVAGQAAFQRRDRGLPEWKRASRRSVFLVLSAITPSFLRFASTTFSGQGLHELDEPEVAGGGLEDHLEGSSHLSTLSTASRKKKSPHMTDSSTPSCLW